MSEYFSAHNPEDYEYCKKLYSILDHGFLLANVFADSSEEALEKLLETSNILNFLEVCEEDMPDYEEDPTYLMFHKGRIYDTEILTITEKPKPKIYFSYV